MNILKSIGFIVRFNKMNSFNIYFVKDNAVIETVLDDILYATTFQADLSTLMDELILREYVSSIVESIFIQNKKEDQTLDIGDLFNVYFSLKLTKDYQEIIESLNLTRLQKNISIKLGMSDNIFVPGIDSNIN